MEISAEQLNRLKDGEYTVCDIRSETDRAYGFIPGSVHITAEELCENPPTDRDKKIIIYCAHGIFSIDVADRLCEIAALETVCLIALLAESASRAMRHTVSRAAISHGCALILRIGRTASCAKRLSRV